MIALVAPFTQSFDDIWLTYQIPESWKDQAKKGNIVWISIGTKETLWIIIDIKDTTEYDKEKIKPISKIYEELTLSPLQIYLIRYIAHSYFVSIHKSASLFFSKFNQEKLIKGKFLLKSVAKNYTDISNKTLSKKQTEVLNGILSSEKNQNLLWGVTGSGKTEIYREIIRKMQKEEKQILLLIPEIILWSQIVERLSQVFWKEITFIHSILTEKEKHEIWKSIYLWDAKIIVWTRSALFYPYRNLWYIIQDEEHDKSYHSENSPRYTTNEILEQIGDTFWIKILYASGTPSIKTMYKAQTSKNIWYFWLLEEYE